MSYDIFKSNMLSYMRNQRNIGSKEEFAAKLVQEYDALIKRGYDTVNGITLQQGNPQLMYNTLVGVLNTAFQQSSGEHAIITNMGPAFQAYWVGIGALTPASVVNSVVKLVESIIDDVMTPEDIAAAKEEIKGADKVLKDPTISSAGKSTASEYKQLKEKEISSGVKNASTPPLSAEELEEIEKLTPDELKCEAGTRVVAIAKKDIGILETGTSTNNGAGKNYGGKLNPNGELPAGESGRIDVMMKNTGLDNPAKVKKDGEGYYWCAGAVTTWWKEAGLPTPPGAAACKSWGSWAKKNGYYSKKPKIGAAILYGTEGSEHHIGIVSGIVNGAIITIEGNTSGGGFNRNGCGCFQKTPKSWSGFVLPPDCVSKL